jgi:hypothetical protein
LIDVGAPGVFDDGDPGSVELMRCHIQCHRERLTSSSYWQPRQRLAAGMASRRSTGMGLEQPVQVPYEP